MTKVIQFLSNAKETLTPAEWEFFRDRYMRKSEPPPLPSGGEADLMRQSVLRKLRGGVDHVASPV